MKIEVADAASLPAWLQSHVSEGQLDLAALPEPEDVSGLKSALQKERGNVAEYAKLGSVEEITSKIADLEKAAKGTGKAAEDAQAKLDALEAKYAEQLKARDQRIDKMMRGNTTEAFRVELAKAGFIAEAIDDVAASGMGRIQFNEDGSPSVLTADGKPMIGSGEGHSATLADLAQELAKAKPYAVRDAGKSGSGTQPGSGGKPPSNPLAAKVPGFSDLPEK